MNAHRWKIVGSDFQVYGRRSEMGEEGSNPVCPNSKEYYSVVNFIRTMVLLNGLVFLCIITYEPQKKKKS
jgi:hypothetical protein